MSNDFTDVQGFVSNAGGDTAIGLRLPGGATIPFPGSGSAISLENSLDITTPGSALDAAQGPAIKALIDEAQSTAEAKLSPSNLKTINGSSLVGSGDIAITGSGSSVAVINDLTTGGPTVALSAQQGVVLKADIDAKLSSSGLKTINGTPLVGSGDITITGSGTSVSIVNDLTTGGSTAALSAAQGVVLKADIDAKQATLNTSNLKTVNGTSLLGSGDVTIAAGGAAVTVVNDLTTGGSTSALSAAQGIILQQEIATKAPLNSPAFTGTPTGITKAAVGLGSVDNTPDVSKPVSTAQQSAIGTAIAGVTPASIGAVATGLVGAANGIPTLDSGGKVPLAQIPASLVGSLNFSGVWNASTNSPTLASGTGSKGLFYKVSVAGTTTLDGNSQWNVGDAAIYDGTAWDKLDGVASEIVSINGRTGAVVLTAADVALGNVNNTADSAKPVSSAQAAAITAAVAALLQSGALATSITQAPNATAVLTAITTAIAALLQSGVLAASTTQAPNATAVMNAIAASIATKANAATEIQVTASRAILASDFGNVLVNATSGPIVLTLPSGLAPTVGAWVGIKRTSTGSITVTTSGTATLANNSLTGPGQDYTDAIAWSAAERYVYEQDQPTVATSSAPIVITGSSAVGGTLVANIAPGYDTTGNWTRAGTAISGATSAAGYVSVSADGGNLVTWKPAVIIGFTPVGVTVAASVAGAPTGQVAGTPTSTTLPISWTAPASNGGSAITDYLIEYSPNGGTTYTAFAHTASAATSATITGLTSGVAYTTRVSAINGLGTGAPSSTITTTTATAAGSLTAAAGTISAINMSTDGTSNWLVASNGLTAGHYFTKTAANAAGGVITPALTGGAITNANALQYSITATAADEQGGGGLSAVTSAVSVQGDGTAGHAFSAVFTVPIVAGGVAHQADIYFKPYASSTTLTFALSDGSATLAPIVVPAGSTTLKYTASYTSASAGSLTITLSNPQVGSGDQFLFGAIAVR